MTSCIKKRPSKSLFFLCLMALVANKNLKASDLFDHDPVARKQSFDHPQFGTTFGISVFPVSNFVKDSHDRQDLWKPGASYYRHVVLREEGLDIYKSYQKLDQLYRENHPDIACKYEVLMAKDEPSIPLITHSIWLTNLDSPVELTDKFIGWFKGSCGLHLAKNGWKHYLWVQKKDKLPKTVKVLEEAGIEIRELESLEEGDFQSLKGSFSNEISESRFGRASDILRCVLLNKFGGIYRDIDFEMTRPLTGLTLAYDFFAGIEFPYSYPCNAIMGCRPAHPIVGKMLEIIARNYDPEKAPAYIKESLKVGGERLATLCLTGPIALGVALKSILHSSGPIAFGQPIKKQPDGRKDRNIILPPEVFYTHGYGGAVCSFGWHAFAGTWLKHEFGSKG